MSDQIVQELNNLAEAEARIDAIRLMKQEAIAAVMPPPQELPPEIQQALADINGEFEKEEAEADFAANELRKGVKELVLEHKASVKGAFLQAVFSKRTTWDNKKLEGFAMAHPEILEAQKVTPGVAIRKVK